jgi:Tfp pilus assembly protein PilN
MRVVIEVSGSRLRMGVVRGGVVVRSRAQTVEGAGSGAVDLLAMAALGQEWVREFGAEGSEAIVLFDGSGTAAVLSCPGAAGSEGSLGAARLGLSELAGFGVEQERYDLAALEGDKGAEGKRHVLGVAERSARIEEVTAWARGLGVAPTVVLPLAAAVMAHVVGRTRSGAGLEGEHAGSTHARLWIGESQSVLVAGSGAQLKFVRVLGIGTGTLVEALSRPARALGEDRGAAITRGEAWGVMERYGIPSPGDRLEVRAGERKLELEGSAVLPMLQPVLQRLSVDLKQSLRFGLSESERAGLVVSVEGPGAVVPRLAEVIGQLGGVRARVDAASGQEGGAGSLWPGLDRLRVNLVPESVQQELTARRSRWSMRVGLGTAAVIIGLHGLHASMALKREEATMAATKADLEKLSERNALTARAEAGRLAERTLKNRITAALGNQTSAAQILAVLAEVVPTGVALTGIDVSVEGAEGPTATLSGVINPAEAGEFSAAIERMSDELKRTPLVRGTRLGAVRREPGGDAERRRFELVVSLVPVRGPVLVEALASVDERGAGANGGTK